MKQDNGASIEFLGAVGMATTGLIDIDSLRKRTTLRVGAIPTVGKA